MTTSKQTASKKTTERKEPEVKKAVQTMLRKIRQAGHHAGDNRQSQAG